MTITQLVDRGLQIRAQLKTLTKELAAIESALADAGLYHDQVPLKDETREGRRYLARGTDFIVPVLFTADKLVGSFKADSAVHARITAAAHSHFAEFFELTSTFENKFDDGKRFRAHADQMLGQLAPKFVTACLARDKHGIPKSDIKITWDDAEPTNG